jgi:hypothetical protein
MRTGELLVRTLQLRPAEDTQPLVRAWSEVRADGLGSWISFEAAPLWLLRRLRELGAEAVAPRTFIDNLAARVRGEAARNMLVDAEAVAVARHLDAAGIRHVMLKGMARRAAGARYPCGDARATHDVDVMVPESDASRASAALRAAGYHGIATERPHHAQPLIGPGSVAVELHTSSSHTLPAAEAWRRANDGGHEVAWGGQQVRIPSATELLWHGMTHALQHGVSAWRLRFLLDGASVLAGDDAIAWDVVQSRLAAPETRDAPAARRWLSAAAQLAGVTLPPDVAGSVSPPVVRHLLGWRLSVLARRRDAGLGARLLEEGARIELGMPPAEVVPGTGLLKQTRRWLAGRAARGIYRVWRATRSRP